MLKLLGGVDLKKYTPIEFLVADTDSMSIPKVEQFEESFREANNNSRSKSLTQSKSFEYNISRIRRSREVGQSYVTSVFTTLLAFFNSISLLFKMKPQLLLLNGPGTCVPICVIIFIFSRILFMMPRCQIVFIESICRVKTLSMSGKIFYHLRLTDYFIVQWKELHERYPRTVCLGRLV